MRDGGRSEKAGVAQTTVKLSAFFLPLKHIIYLFYNKTTLRYEYMSSCIPFSCFSQTPHLHNASRQRNNISLMEITKQFHSGIKCVLLKNVS